MSNIQSVIKNIQDIMRKDAGVDGDAQRLSQLVWMLFLKIFDDQGYIFESVTGIRMRDVSGGTIKPPEWLRDGRIK